MTWFFSMSELPFCRFVEQKHWQIREKLRHFSLKWREFWKLSKIFSRSLTFQVLSGTPYRQNVNLFLANLVILISCSTTSYNKMIHMHSREQKKLKTWREIWWFSWCQILEVEGVIGVVWKLVHYQHKNSYF